MRIRSICHEYFLVALLISWPAYAEEASVENTLQTFYSWVLGSQTDVLPSADERNRLSQVLSSRLIQLLAVASETEELCLKVANEGEKPNIFEGDIFIGTYEGATEVAYDKVVPIGNTALVGVEVIYVDTRFPKAHKYRTISLKSKVELRYLNGMWVIENILFDDGGSLVDVLSHYVTTGKQECSAPIVR